MKPSLVHRFTFYSRGHKRLLGSDGDKRSWIRDGHGIGLNG